MKAELMATFDVHGAVRCILCIKPLTPKISLVIPLTVCHTVVVSVENLVLYQLIIP